MTWLILTFLAVFSRAVYGVLTKVLSNHIQVSAITQTALLMVAGTIWGILLSPFLGGIHLDKVPELWLPVIIAIITSALGNVFYFKGIAKLQAGTTQIAFSSILIWGVIMTWVFLGTSLGVAQSLGVLILLIAILLAQYQKKAFQLRPGILLIIASAANFAAFQVVSAHLAQSLNPGTYLVVTYFGDAILIGLPYLAQIARDLRSNQSQISLISTLALTGAMSIIYNVFAYIAYKAAPDPGIVVLLLTSQVILAVILSIIFLKERDKIGMKLTAGFLAVVAAVLIKSS